MPECPRCGREITSLKCVRERTERYYQELRLAEGGPEYEGGWHYDGDSCERIYYACPICSYRIARDEEGAIRFLRGGRGTRGGSPNSPSHSLLNAFINELISKFRILNG